MPDRILIGRDGRVAFIEFKQPGKRPTKIQDYYLDLLQSRKCKAYWVTTVADAIAIINNLWPYDCREI